MESGVGYSSQRVDPTQQHAHQGEKPPAWIFPGPEGDHGQQHAHYPGQECETAAQFLSRPASRGSLRIVRFLGRLQLLQDPPEQGMPDRDVAVLDGLQVLAGNHNHVVAERHELPTPHSRKP